MRRALASIIFSICIVSATAYCLPGITASGVPVREGICAGGNKYFGKTIKIYQINKDGSQGKLIGTYDCLDKGGTDAIRKGYVIDVWRPDLNSCQEFMNLVYENGAKGKVYLEVDENL